MKKSNSFIFLACFLFFSCTLHSPLTNGVFHSDEAHTGVFTASPMSSYKNFGAVKWKFKTAGKIFSSPVIADGITYVGSEDSNFYAIQSATGELSWIFHTHGAVSSSPAVNNQIVYFTSYDGYCYAADAKTGKEIWKFNTEGEKKVGAKGLWTMKPADMYMEDLWDFFLSSPVVDSKNEGTIFFGSSDGNLYAVNAGNGVLKWKFKTNGIIHTSPAIYNGTVFFGSWDTYLYAVDEQTGKEKWKFKTKDQPGIHLLEGIQASPVIYDSLLYFGARDGFFYALHTNSGALAWDFSADNSWVLTTAAIKDNTVYFGTSDTYMLIALDAKTGKKKYIMKAKGYLYSSPAIAGQVAYYGDFTGNLYALDLNSEGKSWQAFSTEGRRTNAARILNRQGDLDFAFTAGVQDLSLYESSVDVMNEFYNLGSIVSSPAISGNTIYFGSADGYLYAIELKN
jgi:eukaryotic-like serine/threonine-protein kinase